MQIDSPGKQMLQIPDKPHAWYQHYIFIVLLLLGTFHHFDDEGESSSKQYIVRFNDNNSKRWDGKEVWLDTKILNELYDSSELFDDANIIVPCKGKGGKISHWNAVFIDPNSRQGNDNEIH